MYITQAIKLQKIFLIYMKSQSYLHEIQSLWRKWLYSDNFKANYTSSSDRTMQSSMTYYDIHFAWRSPLSESLPNAKATLDASELIFRAVNWSKVKRFAFLNDKRHRLVLESNPGPYKSKPNNLITRIGNLYMYILPYLSNQRWFMLLLDLSEIASNLLLTQAPAI